jgi:hypothetical protein
VTCGHYGAVVVLSPGRRRALLVVRRLYAAVLVGVVVWLLATRRDDIRELLSSARPLLLLACLLAAFGQLGLTSAVWTSGLRALGSPVAWRTSLGATAASGPARYLPGSIWYAVSRGAALQRAGVPVRALAAVATLETLLIPVAGFALGALLLATTGTDVAGSLSLPLLVVAVALLALASPPVVNAALRFRPPADGPPLRLSWPALVRVMGWITAFWLWGGAVFALYVAAFPAATSIRGPAGFLTVMGAYMVAWGVGWLALFAPQGIGVFEVTLAALLTGGAALSGASATGPAALAAVLAGYRALVVVRDLSAAGVALLLRRRGGQRQPVDTATSSPTGGTIAS